MSTTTIIREVPLNSAPIDRPRYQAEVLPTGQILITFPRSGAPSIVVRKEHLELALVLKRLSSSDKERVGYLVREIGAEFLSKLLEEDVI